MGAPKGNKYWQLVVNPGRKPRYTPEALWAKAIDYFEWVEENPLKEQKIYSGVIFELSKMRAMTLRGFCLFAGISQQTLANYQQNKDFVDILACIRDIIYQQKFEGAAADLLNTNIIARELGLAERSDVRVDRVSGEVGKNADSLPEDELARLIRAGHE